MFLTAEVCQCLAIIWKALHRHIITVLKRLKERLCIIDRRVVKSSSDVDLAMITMSS